MCTHACNVGYRFEGLVLGLSLDSKDCRFQYVQAHQRCIKRYVVDVHNISHTHRDRGCEATGALIFAVISRNRVVRSASCVGFCTNLTHVYVR
jgi:hypothetical protein